MCDNMTEAELLFTSLAELTTRHVAEKDLATGLDENAVVARKGGELTNRAKNDFEKLTGKKVVSQENFLASDKKSNKAK